ncbi:MAG: D-alanine--D-alanine ligase family protein [Candidatus Muiribacteriota bacterium]
MDKKIGLLMGGKGREREISLRSGKNIKKALMNLGYQVYVFDTDDNLLVNLRKNNIDKVYNALHGNFGEDGTIQGMLDLYNIKYTGSKVLGSAICMNKNITKKIISDYKIPTPQSILLKKEAFDKTGISQLNIDFPVIAKPNQEGSSISVEILEKEKELINYLQKNLEVYKEILIEKYIQGREFTVGVIGCENLTVLPILELKPENRFYDYEAKYTPGMTEFIFPDDIGGPVKQKIESICLKTHQVCQCYGVSRIDLILDKNNSPWIIEVNTSPGMTLQSDLPAQAEKAGIKFDTLIEKILQSAT